MAYYDLIEIGTSDFATVIQEKNEETHAILVEPIAHYLKKLPESKNIIKVNSAISNYNGKAKIFYIPEENLKKYNLPDYLRGCNSINDHHPTAKHLVQLANFDLDDVFLVEEIDVIDFFTLTKRHNITGCGYLKVDTEGHDVVILNSLFDYYEKKLINFLPLQIFFETNILSNQDEIDIVLTRSYGLNYKLISRGHDTLIVLNN